MSMARGHRLWATICEIEPGLFQAIYSNTGSALGEQNLPVYETGHGLTEAKRRFEKDVQAFGYSDITWVDVNAADLVLPRPGDVGQCAGEQTTPRELRLHHSETLAAQRPPFIWRAVYPVQVN
jgi:hypothetical protein